MTYFKIYTYVLIFGNAPSWVRSRRCALLFNKTLDNTIRRTLILTKQTAFRVKEHTSRPNECPIRLGWLGKVWFGLDLLKFHTKMPHVCFNSYFTKKKEHIFTPNECPIHLGWLGKVGFGLDLLKFFVSISFQFQ